MEVVGRAVDARAAQARRLAPVVIALLRQLSKPASRD